MSEQTAPAEKLKLCWKCQAEHPVTAFNKNTFGADGLQSACRAAQRAYGRAYYARIKAQRAAARAEAARDNVDKQGGSHG